MASHDESLHDSSADCPPRFPGSGGRPDASKRRHLFMHVVAISSAILYVPISEGLRNSTSP